MWNCRIIPQKVGFLPPRSSETKKGAICFSFCSDTWRTDVSPSPSVVHSFLLDATAGGRPFAAKSTYAWIWSFLPRCLTTQESRIWTNTLQSETPLPRDKKRAARWWSWKVPKGLPTVSAKLQEKCSSKSNRRTKPPHHHILDGQRMCAWIFPAVLVLHKYWHTVKNVNGGYLIKLWQQSDTWYN